MSSYTLTAVVLRLLLRLRARSLAALLSALTVMGCEGVEQDKFDYQGGISPDPTAILEGTVLYVGPRPRCEYDDELEGERVLGRVILTLFEYDNPPPPEGTATTAVNLLTIRGDELFQRSDCLAQGLAPGDSESITRSVSFRWPGLTLYLERAVDYQIRGFYDYDEDMIPFFSVTRLPTAGDIAGAAVNDLQDPNQGFLRISLPTLPEAKNGLVRSGITVALGNPVWTERPVFRLDANRKLAADITFLPEIEVVDGAIVPLGPASLRRFRAATCASGDSDGASCGLTLEPLGAEDAPQLGANGVELALGDASSYAFYAQPVDVTSVRALDIDRPRVPDGQVDPHPVLGGALGVSWYTPIAILQRIVPDPGQAEREQAARIPRVLLIGSVLLDDSGAPTKASYTRAPIAIPPVAVVELIANEPQCRVPYFAPGTSSLVTDGRLAHCAELPTGYYAVNVLGGIAGGTPSASPEFPDRSDSPIAIAGGRYSSQAWTVPNELGNPAQVEPASVLASQSVAGAFIVHDPSQQDAACMPSATRGLCPSPQVEISENAEGVDSMACLPRGCCEAISHLCGVGRCPLVEQPDQDNARISASPRTFMGTGANGLPIPDCVPFEIPAQCAEVCAGG